MSYTLTEADFLNILQSITQTCLAKTRLAFSWQNNFASLPWLELIEPKQSQAIHCAYGNMFNLNLPELDIKSTPGKFAAQAYSLWVKSEKNINFFTSGSTGVPKSCRHTENLLRQEVASLSPLFKHCSRAVVTVPIQHLYGFMFGLFLPATLGLEICHKPGLPGVLKNNLVSGDLLCTIPLLLKHLSERGKMSGKGISIISAGSPLDGKVFQSLLEQDFKVCEIFGSSETGAMAWRSSPDQPFTLLSHLCRSENEQQLMRIDNPELGIEHVHYTLVDKIVWQKENKFSVHGRLDNIVQVAGYNIDLAQVENVLLKHELVEECCVHLMQHDEGCRLKAFIVPVKSLKLELENAYDVAAKEIVIDKQNIQNNPKILSLHHELAELSTTHLTSHARPVHYTFGYELVRNQMGKVQDWKI